MRGILQCKGKSMSGGSVLIIDDDDDILIAGKLLLKRHYGHVEITNRPETIPELMAARTFDVILLDMNFSPGESSGAQGFEWLARILVLDPDAVVVLITAHGGVNVAVKAMKLGATDFVMKPWENERLLATLSTAAKLKQTRSVARSLEHSNAALTATVTGNTQTMLGGSKALQEVNSLIARAAPTAANVLILGENGTGKELVARAIHQQSERHNKVFIAVDLGSLSESLFESELFGHKKGAFTDAREDRIGRMEAANGGTVFLDEIGNLPLHLQAKLLTVLESRQITPVGSNKPVDIDIRVIAATNRPRPELRDETQFRQDLLFRLNTVEIQLPPLRERQDDIVVIARHYAQTYSKKYGRPVKDFAPATLAALNRYAWPGNIRALKHALERAVILSTTDQFEVADFQLEPITGNSVAQSDSLPLAGTALAPELNLERLEKQAISQALRLHGYNISHAARDLGLTRAALYRRMEKHGL
jgi:DNA-binding NtrC family response regulator